MRQLCSLRSHNAQPLGTGRQPLNAVGRDSFPIHPCFCFSLIRSSAQADDGYSKSVGRVRAKRELTHRHRLCKKNARVANRLTRLDAVFSHSPLFLFFSYLIDFAIIRKGAPLPPRIFIGKAITSMPVAGSFSRLARFSKTGICSANKI